MGQVTLETKGAVAWVKISNVARHNAMSRTMWLELIEVIARVQADPQLRVVVLFGDGDKSFVSGADISEFEGRAESKAASDEYSDAVRRAENALIDCPKPVIAMIRGLCFGGGLGLAVSCDLRYTTSDTRFRMPAARLGLGYGLNNMQHIVSAIGAPGAADIFFTARIFNGTEAERIGLVHRAVPDQELHDLVSDTANMIAANAPLTLHAAKLAIRVVSHHEPSKDQVSEVNAAVARCGESEDYTEGRTAFMEKRVANFKGH
ncbi:MAG: enoyl-CoA hydratase [Burkholderiaceae bacterium]